MALPKINDRFSGAIQKTSLEQKITELQGEINQLRATQSPDLEAQVKTLREQLQQLGESQIKLKLIEPNPQQPRQTITDAAIRAKVRSLDKHGQISPVILIPLSGSRFMLLDGQLRWEAAKKLGWETICAVIVPKPKDINHDSLLTFLHFEDLNPLDKAEAVVQEIVKVIGLKADEIPTVLGTVLKRLERDGKTKSLAELVNATSAEQQQGLVLLGVAEKERCLLLVLLDLGINPGSFKTNLLPMLSLPPDLKIAIRHQGLKGAHATTLASLSAKSLNVSESKAAKERNTATQAVLEQNLTVPETRVLVASIKKKYIRPTPSGLEADTILDRVQAVTRQLKKMKIWEDPQKHSRLTMLLSQLEELIEIK